MSCQTDCACNDEHEANASWCRELEERVDLLSQQIAHALHEILNLKHGESYGEE